MAILGPRTRAALRKFEASDFVTELRLSHNRVRVVFSDGLSETWDLDGRRKRGLRLPRQGLWGRDPIEVSQYHSLRQLDDAYDPAADLLFEYTKHGVRRAGWLTRRLLIHGLVVRLVEEGWVQPEFPEQALLDDMAALRGDHQRYALSPGYLRGQPGRPRTGPPPGMLLCLSTLDWGPLTVPGRPTLEEAWRDPRRMRWAIEGLIRRGQSITRAAIVHRLCCGHAEGLPRKAGPRWTPVSFVAAVLRVLGYDRSPIVLDAGADCGARAVATGLLGGVYLHSPDQEFRTDGPLWRGGAVLEADDGDQGADVAVVDAANIAEFEDAIEQYGCRADRMVGVLPWSDRKAALALRGVSVVRYRPRPYLGDAVLAVWRPS